MGEERAGQSSQSVNPQHAQSEIRSAAELSQFPIAVTTPKLPITIPNPSMALPTSTKDVVTTRSWNTSKLGLRVGVDTVAAGAAGVLVAPIITAIDKGIMENASGRRTLGESLRSSVREMLIKPGSFFGGRPFGLVFVCPTVYSFSPASSVLLAMRSKY